MWPAEPEVLAVGRLQKAGPASGRPGLYCTHAHWADLLLAPSIHIPSEACLSLVLQEYCSCFFQVGLIQCLLGSQGPLLLLGLGHIPFALSD